MVVVVNVFCAAKNCVHRSRVCSVDVCMVANDNRLLFNTRMYFYPFTHTRLCMRVHTQVISRGGARGVGQLAHSAMRKRTPARDNCNGSYSLEAAGAAARSTWRLTTRCGGIKCVMRGCFGWGQQRSPAECRVRRRRQAAHACRSTRRQRGGTWRSLFG